MLPRRGEQEGKRSGFCEGVLFIWCTLHIYSYFSFSKKKKKSLKLFICFENQTSVSPWFRADAASAVLSEIQHHPHSTLVQLNAVDMPDSWSAPWPLIQVSSEGDHQYHHPWLWILSCCFCLSGGRGRMDGSGGDLGIRSSVLMSLIGAILEEQYGGKREETGAYFETKFILIRLYASLQCLAVVVKRKQSLPKPPLFY